MTTDAQRVAVVGGGPAGLMAAEVLASAGLAVTVFELHRSLGRKLLLAGRSGLNLTHTEPLEVLKTRYEPLPSALDAALDAFSPVELRSWVEELGQPTFVGSSGRLFPEARRAAPLLRAWLERLGDLGVRTATGHEWTGWDAHGALRFDAGGRRVSVEADATVLALGGASWPRVSSDGGWSRTLETAGVGIAPLRPANCGVMLDWSEVFVERGEGQPVKNVVASFAGRSVRGELVVTRGGLEGTPVYTLASRIGAQGAFPATIELDLAPDIAREALASRLSGRRPKESQSSWLRRANVAPIAVGLLRESTANALPDDADAMATLMKAVPLEVTRLAPLDRAISTAGGVVFDELDDQLMLRSRPGVFLAGEMLDWDAPTGGYLLQACFATGRYAGEAARRHLEG